MFYQTDQRIKSKLRDDECYLFDILSIFEEVTKHNLTIVEYEEVHKILTQLKYIGDEDDEFSAYIKVGGISGIAQILSTITGKRIYMRLVTKNDDYTHLIGKWIHIKVNGKKAIHFVRMSFDGLEVTWDPWDQNGSRTVKEGKLDSFRYIYAEAI
jgi:hypothetical protein